MFSGGLKNNWDKIYLKLTAEIYVVLLDEVHELHISSLLYYFDEVNIRFWCCNVGGGSGNEN